MRRTYKRVARHGETARPALLFQGRIYEPVASPTFITAGSQVLVQVVPTTRGPKRLVVARVGTEAWETWEEL